MKNLSEEKIEEKKERHMARNYLRGFIHYPELINDERHRAAYNYAKELQINFAERSINKNCSRDLVIQVIDTLLVLEDREEKNMLTIEEMNDFVEKRKHLFMI